jgi:hypothetical protein
MDSKLDMNKICREHLIIKSIYFSGIVILDLGSSLIHKDSIGKGSDVKFSELSGSNHNGSNTGT